MVWNFWEAGWWDQVPLDRCLIETDAPYLGGGGRIKFLVCILGMRGWGDFVRGSMYQGKWWGQFWHRNLGEFSAGEEYIRRGVINLWDYSIY